MISNTGWWWWGSLCHEVEKKELREIRCAGTYWEVKEMTSGL